MENKSLTVNDVEYELVKLLGKGKGGYSYLVKKDNNFYVLKQIHHEPCEYYTFGDKLQSELTDYQKLLAIKIKIPKLLDVDKSNERILKEYINGPTIHELVQNNKMKSDYIDKGKAIAKCCYEHNINIDYYPTNFIVQDEELYYIDYECNEYNPKWNFENWGIKYWIIEGDK